MRVVGVMTEAVHTVKMDDSLRKVGKVLSNLQFHHLLVVEDRKLVGIISDRDFPRAISPFLSTPSEQRRDLDTLDRKVHQIITRRTPKEKAQRA